MRIVVKLGTGLLTEAGHLNRPRMSELVRQIALLRHGDQEITLVSSGTIFAEGESRHDRRTSRKGRAGTGKRPASLYFGNAD